MSGYHAKKRLGQNFLINDQMIERIIAEFVDSPDLPVVEIGAGRGALTLPIAKTGRPIIAVEFDRDLIPYLEKLMRSYPNCKIISDDFLVFDPALHELTEYNLIGNLPYNITSPVIDWLISRRQSIESALFMVQKEMAHRICSRHGSKGWGPLAIITQLFYTSELLFDVPPEDFRPSPDVVSTVIRLIRKPEPDICHFDLFDRLIRTSFRQRRKTLVNNLVPDFFGTANEAVEILNKLDLTGKSRAEEISTSTFLNLTELIHLATL